MYFLEFGDFAIVGASPELLVKVTAATSRRARSPARARAAATPEEDCGSPSDLLADEKERAEHMMLVDLGRNDVGRVCEPGPSRSTS